MNRQLIDELFYIATFDKSRMIDGVYHPYIPLQVSGEPIRYSITEDQMHKFAELIIKEVYKVADDNFYGDPHHVNEYIEDIERVFGVNYV